MFVFEKKYAKYLAAAVVLLLAQPSSWPDSKYTVKKGDTLYSISRTYQITVAELCAANNFSANDVLKVGQTIVIPNADISNAAALSGVPVAPKAVGAAAKTEKYKVQKGDTLYGISKKFNMNISDLISMNNIADNVLKAGQEIKVLNASAPTAATSVAKITSAAKPVPAGGTVAGNGSHIVWPLSNPTVQNVSGKVYGVKLMSDGASEVTAVRSGTVMYVGAYRGFGQVVFVESKTGLIYAYTWLSSISVNKGDYVVYGDTLGKATKEQDSGKQTVTFMVFQNGTPVDPTRAPRG